VNRLKYSKFIGPDDDVSLLCMPLKYCIILLLLLLLFIPSVVKIPRVKNKKKIKNSVGVVRSRSLLAVENCRGNIWH